MQNKNDASNLKDLIKGNLVGSAMLIILLLIFAMVIFKFSFSSEYYLVFYVGALIISSFVSGTITVRKIMKNGLIYGALVSLLPSIIAVITTCIVSRSFNLIYLAIPLISAVSSAFGGIAAVNIKSKKRRR